jgi:hypothetical protein
MKILNICPHSKAFQFSTSTPIFLLSDRNISPDRPVLSRLNSELFLLYLQSRRRAKLFLKSSKLRLHQPLTRRRVCPPLVLEGGAHSLAREGSGESQFRRGDIHCGTLFILEGFGRTCAPVRCAHPSFWAHCHAQRALHAPPPIAASLLHHKQKVNYPVTKCFPSGPNSGRRGRIFFHWAKLRIHSTELHSILTELRCTLLNYAAPY